MSERTRPPFTYRWSDTPGVEDPGVTLARLLENALAALAEVIQQAAAEGSDAAVRWAMEYLDTNDAAEDADYIAYESWLVEHTPNDGRQA